MKHHKNNYTVKVLSEKAEVYKISKAHCLYYFGGSSGVIPEALRGIDTMQQVSLEYKLDFLSHAPDVRNFEFLSDNHSTANKKVIDESVIVNNIKDSWKEMEKLGSRLDDFKSNLFKTNTAKKDLLTPAKTADTNDVESNSCNLTISEGSHEDHGFWNNQSRRQDSQQERTECQSGERHEYFTINDGHQEVRHC